MREETLYEWLSGRESIAAVVDEFYDRVMADDQVNYYFEDIDMAPSALTSCQSHKQLPMDGTTG